MMSVYIFYINTLTTSEGQRFDQKKKREKKIILYFCDLAYLLNI